MKIGIFGIDGFSQGKANIIDSRVETLKQMFNSPKNVYIQADVVIDKEKLVEADGIVAPESAKLDLIVNDMEFVEITCRKEQAVWEGYGGSYLWS